MTQDQRQALESFLVSAELIELESRFSQFNVFEALGVARREVHHSSFLAYLLNPIESHGLRDLFLRRFLQEVARKADPPVVTVSELDGYELASARVRREYENMDIYIRDEDAKLTIVIENKVGSGLHHDQLKKYYKTVSALDPDFTFFGIYLTVDSEDPNDPRYTPISYERVRALVVEILDRNDVLISAPFRSVLDQYAQLLGRRFMADQELKQLCAKIYKRHRQAITILIDNLPDNIGVAIQACKDLAMEEGLTLLECDNNVVRFIPDAFKNSKFESSTALYGPGKLVYLECKRKGKTLVFQCKMDGGSTDERTEVHSFLVKHQPPFKVENKVYTKYQVIFSKMMIEDSGAEMTEEQLTSSVVEKWESLVKPTIAAMSRVCDGAT